MSCAIECDLSNAPKYSQSPAIAASGADAPLNSCLLTKIQGALALLVDAERRHADHLAGLDAGIGLSAAAIDADLAGAQQLLQMPEARAPGNAP